MMQISELTLSATGRIALAGRALNIRDWSAGDSCEAGTPCTAREAFAQMAGKGMLRHLVVGVIGPRDATAAQLVAAERIGFLLGGLGLTLICGGKTGVMEAVSKGCAEAGGLMIGILPGSTPSEANRHVAIALPTGLGEARNMIIAKSARVLIAVGGSYGTLSEVAYGLHFSKPVIGLEGAAEVAGVCHVADADKAVEAALEALLFSAFHPGDNGGCKFPYIVQS